MRAAFTLALLAFLLATPAITPAAERGRGTASRGASEPPPPSQRLPASGTCPRGYDLVGDPSLRARCFATRPSRIWYRAPVIQERTLTGPVGSDLLGRFRPRIGGAFGRRVIRLAKTVGPVGRSGRSARFALTLARAERGSGDTAKVRRFLRGRRFSTFRSTGTLEVPSSVERHYDFCPRGRVRYESTFLHTGLEEIDPPVDVRTGRWQVVRADIAPDGFGTARIRLVADTGERGAVVLAATERGFTLGGEVAEVTSSHVCGRG